MYALILLPDATGELRHARPLEVLAPVKTALNESTLRLNASTLYSRELLLDARVKTDRCSNLKI